MAISIKQFPDLIEWNDYGGQYEPYIEAVFKIFNKDFIIHKASFGSHKLRMRVHSKFQEKPYTFYHMTHSGDIENERNLDVKRCERMPWARMTIENVEEFSLKCWEQIRRGRHRICIWLDVQEGDNYFIILEVRAEYVLLWTAFRGDYKNALEKKKHEYEAWYKRVGRDMLPDELVSMIRTSLQKQGSPS